jgi:hypothetical protein
MVDTMRLLIATPFYEMKGFSPYISSIVKTIMILMKSGIDVDYWELSGDSYIDRARNKISNLFMRSEYTDLLFVDSDMGWDCKSLENIIRHEVDIVGAGYPCKNKWDFWGCVLNTEEGYENTYDAAGRITHVGPPKCKDGLISARFVPTGFMKIRRQVFERLTKECPDNFYVDENGEKIYNFFGRIPPLGEDSSFCKRWTDIGGELWVEPDCTISHYGFKEYKGNYAQYLRSMPEAKRIENVI